MKLLIICRSFNNMAGGIERVATALMNEMCGRGHDVSLLTWDLAGAKPFYEFDERIKWYNLNLGSHKKKAGLRLRLKRLLKMRSLLREIKPDVALAFQHGTFFSTRIYSLGQNIPIIAAEREAPARFKHLKAGKWQGLIYQSFRLANDITIQCESYRNDYPAYLRERITTIPNPVFPAKRFASPAGEPGKRKTLLSIGRLGYQKNHGVLIRAFAKIRDDFPEWDLLIAGEGGDREILENDVKTLGLSGRVALPGAIKDTGKLYCESHLFCLPARWEGFPNVIAESFSHGLPAVGFAECAGTRDLIEDNVSGLLAAGNGDADTLAQALSTLMADDNLRNEMGRKGLESMKQYAPDKVFDQWEAFLQKAAKS
jgi:glycosyltransferase involved in cell wall biosynthesis